MKNIITRRSAVSLTAISLFLSVALPGRAAIITWTNATSGGWNTAANWNPNSVPSTNDTAIITLTNAGVIVSLNGATTVGGITLGTNFGGTVTLSLAGQTLALKGPLTVNPSGSFTVDSGALVGNTNAVLGGTIGWTAGTLGGTLTLASGSTLNITTANSHFISGCTFTNSGTVNWSGGALYSGGGAVFYNYGLWNAQDDQQLNNYFGGTGSVFNNYGTFRKSGGASEFAGYTVFASGAVFNQFGGVIDVQNGTNGLQLNLSGGGNFTSGYITTNVSGLTVLAAGNFTLNGTVTGTNTWADTGTLIGTNVIQGGLTWVGGTWNNTVVTVSSNSMLSINSAVNHFLGGCIVTNLGTVNWSGGTLYSGGGAVFYNYGLWNAQDDQQLSNYFGDPGTVFNNYGTFRKSGGASEFAGYTLFPSGVLFNQLAGVIDVQNGTNGLQLNLSGGGNFTGGYVTTNVSGLTVLGAGNFTVNGTVTGTSTWADTGTLVGTNVINGALTWVGGTWNNTVVTVSSNSVLNINSAVNHFVGGCLFTNFGTVNWSGSTLYAGGGAVFYNYGLWNAQDDQQLNNYYGGSTVFNNYGTFRKSGGASEFANNTLFNTGVFFNQLAGVIDVQNGTNGLQLNFQGGGNFIGGYITTNVSGLTVLGAGNFYLNGTVTGTNTWADTGTLIGTNVINGALTWVGGTWNNTVVTVSSTSMLNIIAGQNHYLGGCLFTNLGIVNWSGAILYAGGGAVVYNYGLWNAQDDQQMSDLSGSPHTVFNNYGTFRKSGGAGEFVNNTIFQSGVVFNQLAGVIDVQNSTNGLQLAFLGGANFTGGYVTTNSQGLVNLAGGSFTLNGTVTDTNTWLNGGTLAGANVINGTLTWVAGTWNGAASVTIAPNATVIVAGGAGNNDLNATVMTNYGTLAWVSGAIRGGNGTAIYNYGLWDAQSDLTLNNGYGGAGTVFNNLGTFRKSGGTNAAVNTVVASGVVFNQLSGVVDVQTGNVLLQGGGNLTGGSITANSVGTTYLNAGYFNINGTTTGTNVIENAGSLLGTNVINGALTWVAGNWNSANLVTIATNTTVTVGGGGGNNDMNATVVTNYGTLAWVSGVIRGGTGTTIYNYGMWDAQSDQTLNSAYGGAGTVFNNLGTFRKSGGTNTSQTLVGNPVTFNNSGVVDVRTGANGLNLTLQGSGSFTGGYFTTNSTGLTYLNAGSFNLNGTITTTNVIENAANLAGTNVIRGGLTWGAGVWSSDNITISSNSTVVIAGGGNNMDLNAGVVTNYGTVAWSSGTLRGGSGAVIYNYGVWNAQSDQVFNNAYGGSGTVFNNLGTFLKTAGANNGSGSQIQGGITFNNNGRLDCQAGVISLQGAYSLTNGTLNFGINSLTNYGEIGLAGAAPLLGTVSANLNNGYIPISGNAFTNLYYGSFTGGFTNAVLPSADAWTTNYFPTYYVMTVLNSRPVFAALATNTFVVNELTTLNVTNTATDADTPSQTLVYSLVAGTNGMAVSSSTGVFTWTPQQANSPSTNIVSVAVTDNGTPPLSATNTYTVIVKEVNVPPSLPTVSTQIVNELTLLTVTNTATNANIHSTITGYTLVSPPSNMVISASGIITWTPAQTQSPGTNLITTIATNSNPFDLINPTLTSTNTFTVIVREVNVAPSLPTILTATVNELTLLTVTNTATNANIHSTITGYTLVSPPSNLVISASGIITWTPAQAQSPSTNLITTIVTNLDAFDLVHPILTSTNTFTVIVKEVNVAPSLPTVSTQIVNELTLLTVTNAATNANIHSTITGYTLVSPLAGMSISTNGVFTWTPAQTQSPSTNLVTTIVTNSNPFDLVNPTLTSTNTFTVIVKELNVAPTLPTIPTFTVDELTLLTVTNTATNANIHATIVGYTLMNPPSNMVVSASGIITWTPAQAQSPSTNLIITIVTNSDAFDLVNPTLTSTNTFTVIVREVNIAPVLPNIAAQIITELTRLTVTNTATETNIHSTLGYTLVNPPSGASISSSGVITWTPTDAQKNTTNTFTTIVTNSNPYDLVNPHLSATNSFTVIVKPALILTGPAWIAGSQFQFSLSDTTVGVAYTIQYSTNLVNWVSALTFDGPGGPITIIDPNAGVYPYRFYRVKHSP